jgi:hypothetical protein
LKIFASIGVFYVPRNTNSVAHVLIKKTIGTQPCVWNEESPSFIIPLLIDDVSIFD